MVAAHATHRRARPVNRLTVIGGRLTAATTQVVVKGSTEELNAMVAEQVHHTKANSRAKESVGGDVGVLRQDQLATVTGKTESVRNGGERVHGRTVT